MSGSSATCSTADHISTQRLEKQQGTSCQEQDSVEQDMCKSCRALSGGGAQAEEAEVAAMFPWQVGHQGNVAAWCLQAHCAAAPQTQSSASLTYTCAAMAPGQPPHRKLAVETEPVLLALCIAGLQLHSTAALAMHRPHHSPARQQRRCFHLYCHVLGIRASHRAALLPSPWTLM